MKHSFLIFAIIPILLCHISSFAQDPFFTHFNNKKSFYNPAATGLHGALSVQTSYKTQWNTIADPAYKTVYINIEDALPCSNFDWGMYALADREGSGLFSTYQGGVRFSYNLADLIPSQDHQQNLRLGTEIALSQHRINYSRLIFSDQIDPKYGFDPTFISGFNIPDMDRSALYFNPNFGLLLQSKWDKDSKQSVLSDFGLSISNSFSLGGQESGHTNSLLGESDRDRQLRYSAFFEVSFLPLYNDRTYISITPLVFYQRQGELNYWEFGASTDLSSLLKFGVYLHNATNLFDKSSTNWISFNGEFKIKTSDYSRTVLDFTYSTNYKGLQNQVGPIFEVGITFHFATSILCNLMGKRDDVFYSKGTPCPISRVSPGKRKLYENVWYEN